MVVPRIEQNRIKYGEEWSRAESHKEQMVSQHLQNTLASCVQLSLVDAWLINKVMDLPDGVCDFVTFSVGEEDDFNLYFAVIVMGGAVVCNDPGWDSQTAQDWAGVG